MGPGAPPSWSWWGGKTEEEFPGISTQGAFLPLLPPPTPALLLAVILVHSSLGKTELLYTPASALNAEAPFPPAFTETS